jgi:hypothetical protein
MPSERRKDNELLLGHIRAVHGRSRGTYGGPRVKVEPNEQGMICGKSSGSQNYEGKWYTGENEKEIQSDDRFKT